MKQSCNKKEKTEQVYILKGKKLEKNKNRKTLCFYQYYFFDGCPLMHRCPKIYHHFVLYI